MNKRVRKAVIPAAGPRIALAFALCFIHSAAHAAALTGRAVFLAYNINGGLYV